MPDMNRIVPVEKGYGAAAAPSKSSEKRRFESGEVYLFHLSDPRCPSTGSLWGVFDKRKDGWIYLESSSDDLVDFRRWHVLPGDYSYCRRASRRELRDYVAGLIYSEYRGR